MKQQFVMASFAVMLATLNDGRLSTRIRKCELRSYCAQHFGVLGACGNIIVFHQRGGLWRVSSYGSDSRWMREFIASIQRHARAERIIKARDTATAISVMGHFGYTHDAALSKMRPEHQSAYLDEMRFVLDAGGHTRRARAWALAHDG